jgi:glycosyltransferase involved in cell wall biosynthesis
LQPPIRLFWLLDSLGVGGAEALSVPFARSYDRGRYELTVGSLGPLVESSVSESLRAAGVPIFEAHAANLHDVAAYRRLRNFVVAQQIDVVHAHLTYSATWSALVSRSTNVPSIASLHVAAATTRAQKPSLRYRLAVDARDRVMRFAVNRWATYVVTVSEALRQTYLESGGLDASKVLVVHNGIDTARFHRDGAEVRARLEREYDIPPSLPIAVTVAVLRPRKGIEVLFDAIERIPGVIFLIVGDGPIAAELRAAAGARGIADRIRWTGFRSDVDAILPGCDLFVHPSLEDAFPTVLLEAMAAGLPVVASRVGGIPEIVQDGVTGCLVPAGDPDLLAEAIRRLLSDRERLQRMKRDAPAIAESRFSTAAWLRRLDDVYASAVEIGGHKARNARRA